MSLSLLNNASIHFLIGENGVGKSLLLGDLSAEISYTYPNAKIIAIANTIQNKFPKLRMENYFRLSSNRVSYIESTVLQAFHSYSKDRENHQVIPLLRRTLNYIGFSERILISFKIKKNIDLKNLIYSMEYIKSVEDGEADKIYGFISHIMDRNDLDDNHRGDYVKVNHYINLVDFIFDYNSEGLLTILKNKYHLKSKKIISDINITLYKNEDQLKLSDASSGELSLLTTLTHISTHIGPNTYILIDEPENSLHPRWQRDYVNHIYNMFYQYDPKIILATHSPMIVSGAYSLGLASSVYEVKNGEINQQVMTNTTNVEEILVHVFQLLTPQNRYFSHSVNKIISQVLNGEISESELFYQIGKIRNLSLDDKQIKIIETIPNIIEKIKKNTDDNDA